MIARENPEALAGALGARKASWRMQPNIAETRENRNAAELGFVLLHQARGVAFYADLFRQAGAPAHYVADMLSIADVLTELSRRVEGGDV